MLLAILQGDLLPSDDLPVHVPFWQLPVVLLASEKHSVPSIALLATQTPDVLLHV